MGGGGGGSHWLGRRKVGPAIASHIMQNAEQVCGARTHLFVGEGETPESEGPIAKAFEVVKEIAEKYSKTRSRPRSCTTFATRS